LLNPRLKKIFLDIIQIDAVSHQEKPLAEYIKSFCEKLNVTCTLDYSSKHTGCNTDNIIVNMNGGGDKVLLSHMDTARSTKGVNALFHEDRITSDGSTVLGVDNRVGIAVLLKLIEDSQSWLDSKNAFTIAFTTCEETTLMGSKHLVLNKNIKQGFVFDSYLKTGSFVNQSFGAANFYAEFLGKSAHAGIAPEKGINALKAAVEAVNNITLGRVGNDTTVNIGEFKSDCATNVIPDKTILSGEVRSISEAEVVRCIKEIKKIFTDVSNKNGTKLDLNYDWVFKPYCVNSETDVYKTISSVMKKVGLTPVESKSWGGSDANSLNERGIQTVNIGIGAQNPHSNDEFILYEDFENSYKIARALVEVQ
jgi:tripeptide aminopeptidase